MFCKAFCQSLAFFLFLYYSIYQHVTFFFEKKCNKIVANSKKIRIFATSKTNKK